MFGQIQYLVNSYSLLTTTGSVPLNFPAMVSNQHKLEIKGYSRHSMKYDHSKLTRASPCTSSGKFEQDPTN
jgi:hypothetical protein